MPSWIKIWWAAKLNYPAVSTMSSTAIDRDSIVLGDDKYTVNHSTPAERYTHTVTIGWVHDDSSTLEPWEVRINHWYFYDNGDVKLNKNGKRINLEALEKKAEQPWYMPGAPGAVDAEIDYEKQRNAH